jgi:exonuclease 3'-5' domain-containing protein 2
VAAHGQAILEVKIMSMSKKTDHVKRVRLLNRNGRQLSWCMKRKMEWYLREGLAIKVSEDAIQLLVQTAVDDKQKHPESLSYKDCCVVCGHKKELSAHHVIPYSFVRFFPNDWKEYCEHDVVYLCTLCHIKYEELAYAFRLDLLKKYGVDAKYNRLKGSAIAAAKTLKKEKSLPTDVREKLLSRVSKFMGKESITKTEIESFSKRKMIESDEERPSAQLVRNVKDIGEFCLLWRKHFVATMNPQHLPNGWDVNYDRTSKGLLL